MPKHMKHIVGLGLIATSLVLSGCESQMPTKTVIKSEHETTTVIDSTDAIKPQKGAAKIIQTIENFEGYGWVDDKNVIGYQFSSSVFGDDRGLVYKSLSDQENVLFKAFDGKPQIASLSQDGLKLAVVKEGTGRKKPLFILDLDSQKVFSYESSMLYTPWQFNWFEDGTGAALTPLDSQKNMLSLLDASGGFSEFLIGYTPKKLSGESYISLGTTLGKRGQDIYFLVYSDDAGIYKRSLTSGQTEQVLSLETASQFALAPRQDYMAVTSFKKSGTGSELLVYNLKGEKVFDLYKALNFNQLVWSKDGNTLVFEAIETSGESSLYAANMTTGQTHFLGSYTGYSIKQVTFNQASDQLMVTYVNQLMNLDRVDTQILALND